MSESLNLAEAAQQLGLSIVGFLDYVRENDVPYEIKGSSPVFSLDSLVQESSADPVDSSSADLEQSPLEQSLDSNPVDVEQAGEEETSGFDLMDVDAGVSLTPSLLETSPSPSPYDYANKNRWREMWMEFCKRNLPTPNADTKMLFLGGHGDEIPLYLDQLGLEIGNLVAVEKKLPLQRKLRRKFPGLDVRSDLASYLRTTSQKFDAIIIDYDGGICKSKVKQLERIVRGQLLKDQSLFAVNIDGHRDTDELRSIYVDSFMEEEFASFKSFGSGYRDGNIDQVLDCDKNWNNLRSFGLTALMFRLMMGKDSVVVNDGLLKQFHRSERAKIMDDLTQQNMVGCLDYLRINERVRSLLMEEIRLSVDEEPSHLPKLALVLDAHYSKPYIIGNHARYCYNSKSGNYTFNSDFLAVEKYQVSSGLANNRDFKRLVNGKLNIVNLVRAYNGMGAKGRREIDKRVDLECQRLAVLYSGMFLSDQTPDRIKIE